MIQRTAKKILSFMKTKDTQINNKIDYAKQLAQSMNSFFEFNKLKKDYIRYSIKVYPFRYIENYPNQTDFYTIKIIMFYVDKLKSRNYPVRDEYKQGVGEAISQSEDQQYIVIYGHSVKKEYNTIDYFKNTFIHEMIHILDYCADHEERQQEDFYGHPVQNVQQNGGIPYPGMYGKDDDFFDEIFAEYYTCKAERRQYIYELLDFIQEYSEYNKIEQHETIDLILSKMVSKNIFKKFINKIKSFGYNYIALMFLYHLSFSKQKNGRKSDAVKILKSFY